MFALCLYLIAILVSAYLWGLIRTAIWIFPSILMPELGPVLAASLLSFWTISSFLSPYGNGFFDFRDFPSSRWFLAACATALLAGSMINPFSSAVFIYCLVSPAIILFLFYLLRHPPNQILYLPQKTKWILAGLWIFCAAVRVLENQFYFLAGS